MESVFLLLIFFFFFLDQANKMKPALLWYCMACNLSNLVAILGEMFEDAIEFLVSEKLHVNTVVTL